MHNRNSVKQLSAIAAGLLLAGTAALSHADNMMAKKDYMEHCSACHGTSGKGDGPEAKKLKQAPADLTQLSKNNAGHFPYMYVRKVIDGRVEEGNIRAHSSKEMPVWGDVFNTAFGTGGSNSTGNPALAKARILNVVDYLASIQVK